MNISFFLGLRGPDPGRCPGSAGVADACLLRAPAEDARGWQHASQTAGRARSCLRNAP